MVSCERGTPVQLTLTEAKTSGSHEVNLEIAGPVASGERITEMILKTFALKMIQAKARIWP